MKKQVFKKLIRDKIPELIEAQGKKSKVSVLNQAEFLLALRRKLIEEANEVVKAPSRQDLLTELCDVEEVVQALLENNNFVWEDLEKHRQRRSEKRGGFEKRLFLEYIESGEEDDI